MSIAPLAKAHHIYELHDIMEDTDSEILTSVPFNYPLSNIQVLLSNMDQDLYVIRNCYNDFTNNGFQKENFFKAQSKLNNMEHVFHSLSSTNPNSHLDELKEQLQTANSFIQAMNQACPYVSSEDVKKIKAFFLPPVGFNHEARYTDEQTGKSYYQPDHSKLVKEGVKAFALGGYKGFGLMRKHHIQGYLCEFLYFTKTYEQIQYEKRQASQEANKSAFKSIFSSLFEYAHKIKEKIYSSDNAYMELKIKKQEEILQNSHVICKQLAKEGNYLGHVVCNSKQLLALGFNKDYALAHHAVIFYYKELSQNHEDRFSTI